MAKVGSILTVGNIIYSTMVGYLQVRVKIKLACGLRFGPIVNTVRSFGRKANLAGPSSLPGVFVISERSAGSGVGAVSSS